MPSLNPSGVPWVTDPTFLPKSSIPAANLYQQGAGGTASTAATFWTGAAESLNRSPASIQDDTNVTSSFKSLGTITGPCVVYNLIGPTAGSSGEVTTWQLTPDGGAPVSLALTAQANTSRTVVGAYMRDTVFNATQWRGVEFAGTSSDGITANINGSQQLASPMTAMWNGGLLLFFRTSLLVEVKHSVTISGTANQERRTGVSAWRLN